MGEGGGGEGGRELQRRERGERAATRGPGGGIEEKWKHLGTLFFLGFEETAMMSPDGKRKGLNSSHGNKPRMRFSA